MGGILAIAITVIAFLSIKLTSHMDEPSNLKPGVYAEIIRSRGTVFNFFSENKPSDGGRCSTCLVIKNNSSHMINIATPDTEWQLYKQTNTGWQPFYGHSINRFGASFIEYHPPNGEFIEPQQEKTYWAAPLLVLGTTNRDFDPYGILTPRPKWETINNGGNFILQLAYTTILTQGVVTRTTYTPPFASKQTLSSNDAISITIKPQLLEKNDGTWLVQLEIMNRTNRTIWLRPLGLSIMSLGLDSDIRWMRKVDETSWEYVDLKKDISNHNKQLIDIEAQTTHLLQGRDFNTKFVIDNPGTYGWIVPIWLEYLPKGHGIRRINNPDVPFLNQMRYVFSEELEVR